MLPELTEASYLSRFFEKFVEIIAAGFATAMCAYLIGHLGSPLSVATPAPAAVSAGSTASEVAASLPAKPAPPVAAPPIAAAPDEQGRAPQPVPDASPAQLARKERAAMAAPAPKDIKASTNAARSEKSAEALARAALANVDAERPAANRPAPAEGPIRRKSTGTGAAAVGVSAAVAAQQRTADMLPRQVDIPPPPAAFEAQQPRRVTAVEPLPQNAGSAPPEIAAPRPEPPADRVDGGLFSFFKRSTPSLASEAPRPPVSVGITAPE
jgi:hypothetical protein